MAAVAGVIAEYNPFHLGHAYQLAAIRERLGSDTAIVAVMSGNFVQRGECAIMAKHARAEAAVLGGADLVLELPSVYAAATAEIFARGGVEALAATGVVTHLCFGSECGDIAVMGNAAECLESDAYHRQLRQFLDEGMTFAAARQAAVGELIGAAASCLSMPNNNLGVEYLRAMSVFDASMEAMTIRRIGDGHDSEMVGEYPSASAIRRAVLNGGTWQHMVPEGTEKILCREMDAGRAPASMTFVERALLSKLRAMEEDAFRPYDGGEEGLYHRFYKAVRQGNSLEEILRLAKTKRYTHARLRRMALAAWLGMEKEEETLPYLRVLAVNERGRAVLKMMKKTATLPVITKSASVRRLGGELERFFAEEAKYTDLYALCCPKIGVVDSEYTTDPVIL